MRKSLLTMCNAILIIASVGLAAAEQPQQDSRLATAVQNAFKIASRTPETTAGQFAPEDSVWIPEDFGRISGQLNGIFHDGPVRGEVFAWQVQDNVHNEFMGIGIVHDDHSYAIEGLPPGDYVVIAYVEGFVPQFYGNTVHIDSAKIVNLAPGDNLTGIDIDIEAFPETPASISGIVLDEMTDAAVDSAFIVGFALNNPFIFMQAISEDSGQFILKNLLPGTYVIHADADGYLPEFYQDKQQFTEATPFEIADSTEITDVKIALQRSSRISGTITHEDGHPLHEAMIYAIPANSSDMLYREGFAISDEEGKYTIEDLTAGDYYIKAVYADGFHNQEKWWSGDDGSLGRIPVTIGSSEEVTGIDFVFLVPKMNGIVEGFVYNFDGAPIQGAHVFLESVYGKADSAQDGLDFNRPIYGFSAITDSSGFFQFSNLPAGEYIAAASISQAGQYAMEWWKDAQTREEAEVIAIDESGKPFVLEFNLHIKSFNSVISGVVSDQTGRPLVNAWVNVHPTEITRCRGGAMDPSGRCMDQTSGWAQTDSSGFYEIGRLASGEYFAHVQYWEGISFGEMWYENAATQETATPIFLPENEEVANINFELNIRPIYGQIAGVVLDEESGEPITRAHVELTPIWHDRIMAPIWYWNHAVTVDSSGRFEFSWLPEGDYLVSVYANGAFAYFKNAPVPQLADSIHVIGGGSAKVEFNLTPRNNGDGQISGWVESGWADFPVELGVVIARPTITILSWPESELFYTAVTEPDGSYKLTGLPDGEYYLQGFANNFIPEYYKNTFDPATAQLIKIESGAQVPGINFELVPMLMMRTDGAGGPALGGTASLSGLVTNDFDVPIADARVYLYDQAGNVIASAKTNANGEYVFSGVQNGEYHLLATHFGNTSQYNDNSQSLENAPVIHVAGDIANINFSLPSGMPTSVNEEETEALPQGLQLLGNYPNPFNPETRIKFMLGEQSHVTLHIYNLLGKEVATLLDKNMAKGEHTITWDARGKMGNQLGTGLYFYQITTGKMVKTGKMILQK
ncbi:MAG: T9SS C-terminal target domain-containing protein [Calditrichaeota bacterium]|nr:MAG: T9SS C-terminal target domain-containing protein [Calditrichota bacterium]